ncbi:DNA methyltransferase [Streptococcus infantis]|uniref:site-specific DNA-methyltransferase n=1 Tax=Streptococcus infantis TaxID=68892 RepID=UPI00204B54D2|nr:MAG TPA: adenine specific DNA methyltransferase [Caudoviricetes sp.]
MKIELLAIDKIKMYENNAKLHPREQIEQIKKSILEFGNNDPIAVDEHNVIIEGHGRFVALKELGYDEVEIIRLSHLTDEQKRAYILAHNKLTMNSGFDMDILELELEDITNINMEDFGFDFEDIEEAIEEVEQDEYDEELRETNIKPGDIFQLGEHRLSCGDSTDAKHIQKLLDGVKVDTVYTDPPYGMKKEKDGVQNDNLNYDDLLEFNKKWVPITFDAMREVGSWYCWGIDEPLMDLYSNILRPMKEAQKITFRNLLTWDKGNTQGQMAKHSRMYPIADEKCLFVMKGVQGFNTNLNNYFEGYEVIRKPLSEAAERVGLTSKKLKEITGVGMYSHWFTKAQWLFIPLEQFQKIADYYGNEWNLDYNRLKQDYDRLRQDYNESRAFFDATHANFNNVLHFSRTSGDERESAGGHATPKPLALVALMLKSSTRKGDVVLDVFGGSGSTLIACERLGRTCYINELEPKYVDLIIRRWEKETGREAVKLN